MDPKSILVGVILGLFIGGFIGFMATPSPDVSGLENQIEFARRQIKELQQEVTVLQDEKDTLQTSVQSKDVEIGNLTEEVARAREAQIVLSRERVEIDKMFYSDGRVDVGSVQTVRFHAKWGENDTDIVEGDIYVNGTRYVTNATGWIEFNVSQETVSKKIWTVTGVNCSGITDFIQTVENPSVIWDQVEVYEGGATSSNVGIHKATFVWFKARFEYDSAEFDEEAGILVVTGSNCSWSTFNGRWELNVVREMAGTYLYTVGDIRDLRYGLSALEAEVGAVEVTWLKSMPSISDVEDKIFNAPDNSVYFVPTGDQRDDSVFYALYSFKDNPQLVTPPSKSPTSSAYFDEDGSPLFTGNVVTIGGRFTNRMVRYYEDAGIALVGYGRNETHHLFTRISDGSHLYSVEDSTYNATEKDYFVFQIYRDGDRYIFNEWGIGVGGTYAGGACFLDVIIPNIQDFTNQYYIYSWTDFNNDDMPQQEEIVPESTGN